MSPDQVSADNAECGDKLPLYCSLTGLTVAIICLIVDLANPSPNWVLGSGAWLGFSYFIWDGAIYLSRRPPKC